MTAQAGLAVLPEAQEVDIVIKPEDLEINVCRAGRDCRDSEMP